MQPCPPASPRFCAFPKRPLTATFLPLVESKAKATSFGPAHFINRELSWLEFNHRVLEEALDAKNPLLERVKFFCIVSSNLDEFFEVRVAGIKQQIESDVVERSMDGLTASETFRAIIKRVRRMVEEQYACWREALLPALSGQRHPAARPFRAGIGRPGLGRRILPHAGPAGADAAGH